LSQNHSLRRSLDDINEWTKTIDRKLSIAQPLPLEIAKLTELVSSIIQFDHIIIFSKMSKNYYKLKLPVDSRHC